MAAAKESLPRQSNAKHHSHSLSVGSINPSYRINRRKSTSASNASTAAISAALQSLENAADTSGNNSRKSGKGSSKATFPASLPARSGFDQAAFRGLQALSKVSDSPALRETSHQEEEDEFSVVDSRSSKAQVRMRRASEGMPKIFQHSGRRQAGSELKCTECGKAYKHSSCLYKHQWEHSPHWALTSKLLISKHQQVQLLEAATVLMTISGNKSDEENAVGSSSASGPSDSPFALSSSDEESPSPRLENTDGMKEERKSGKRFSSHSSAYSRSYESSVFSDNANTRHHGFGGHNRQWSSEQNGRPTTSSTSVAGSMTDEEDGEKMPSGLSRSYGQAIHSSGPWRFAHSNGSRLHYTPADAPEVPIVDHLWKSPKETQLSGSGSTIRGGATAESFVRAGVSTPSTTASGQEDIEMADDVESRHDSVVANSFIHKQNHRYHHEAEEGVFGVMDV